jgi:hypothetical protein
VPIVVFQVMGAITYRLIEGFGPLVILLLLIAGAIKLWSGSGGDRRATARPPHEPLSPGASCATSDVAPAPEPGGG